MKRDVSQNKADRLGCWNITTQSRRTIKTHFLANNLILSGRSACEGMRPQGKLYVHNTKILKKFN